MSRTEEKYVVALDIGTSKVCVLVGEINDRGQLEIIGKGTSPMKGTRRGNIINLDQAIEAVKKAVDEAEVMAGLQIESVYVGISGDHIRSVNSRGVVSVVGKHKEIGREDIERVIEASKSINIPAELELLHVIPREFVVDGQDGIHDPIGMTAARLEANVHIVTGARTLRKRQEVPSGHDPAHYVTRRLFATAPDGEQVPISLVTAALGGEFTVPTLDGLDARVKVPEGTQSGRQFRLRGKGMTVLRSRDIGDLYIQVAVETPQNLTRRQRELLLVHDRPASAFAPPRPRCLEARHRPLADDVPLKFGHRAEDVEDELAARRGGVQALPERHELYPALPDAVHELYELL